MKKRIVLLTGLLLLTAYQGFVVSNALGDTGTFTTMWVIDLPRQTYFIGETVSFTVTAFASTDPSLLLPDQMAKITIRNSSMVEVYDTWITTNSNGSAPVSWASSLNTTADNYTIILDDLKTTKVTAQFNMLYNEETYWQTRVDQLQNELQNDRNYLNYLFAYNKFLDNRVHSLERNFVILWGMIFGCLIVGVYCGMYLVANQPASKKGVLAAPGKLLKLMGISSESSLYLQHEEVSQVTVSPEKSPPIYGHDFICKVCKKKGLPIIRMTRSQFEDHMWAHEQVAINRASLKAKLRKWGASRRAEAEKPKPESPLLFGTVNEYAEAELRTQKIAELKHRAKILNKQMKKGKISKEEVNKRLAEIKADKEKLAPKKSEETYVEAPKKEVLIVSTSAMPTKSRKLRGETPLFSEPSGIPPKPSKIPSPKTPIDELFDKLSNEKVN